MAITHIRLISATLMSTPSRWENAIVVLDVANVWKQKMAIWSRFYPTQTQTYTHTPPHIPHSLSHPLSPDTQTHTLSFALSHSASLSPHTHTRTHTRNMCWHPILPTTLVGLRQPYHRAYRFQQHHQISAQHERWPKAKETRHHTRW